MTTTTGHNSPPPLGAVRFVLTDTHLYVANVGKVFTRRGFISLQGAYNSSKTADGGDDATRYAAPADPDEWIASLSARNLHAYRAADWYLDESGNIEVQVNLEYTGRLVLELLQNAHDAACTADGTQIGRFGLGFKSVLSVSEDIRVFSGGFRARFDRDSARRALSEAGFDEPAAGAPIFRFPTLAEPDECVLRLLADGYSTVIALRLFENVRERVEKELDQIDAKHMLFASAIAEIASEVRGRSRHWVRRPLSPDLVEVGREDDSLSSAWRMFLQHDAAGGLVAAIAVQVDRSNHRLPIPSPDPERLWVFFPTEDSLGVRVVAHVHPAALAQNRQRLIAVASNDAASRALCDVFARAALELDPAFVLHALVPEGGTGGAAQQLAARITERLSRTPFLPTYGGAKTAPVDARQWPSLSGMASYFPATDAVVISAKLVAPDVSDYDRRPALDKLNCAHVTHYDVLDLVATARAWDETSSVEFIGSISDLLEDHAEEALTISALSRAQVIWTTRGRARCLDDSPKVDRRQLWQQVDPKAWLETEVLTPLVEEHLCRPHGVWRRVFNDYLVTTAEGHFRESVAPRLRRGDDAFWQTQGRSVIAYLCDLFRDPLSKDVLPLVPVDGSIRTELSELVRVPNRAGGWTSAGRAYATAPWGVARGFRRRAADPSFELPDPDALDGMGDSLPRFLTFAGVSWGPKVLSQVHFREWALWEEYLQDDSVYMNSKRQTQNYSLGDLCGDLAEVSSLSDLVVLLTPVTAALGPREATARCKPYGTQRDARTPTGKSFALHQLKGLRWVPCHPTALDSSTIAAPRDCWLGTPKVEGHAIDGVVPVVNFGNLPAGRQLGDCYALLEELGARRADRVTPEALRRWTAAVTSAIGRQPDANSISRGGDLWTSARSLAIATLSAARAPSSAIGPPVLVFAEVWSGGGPVVAVESARQVVFVDNRDLASDQVVDTLLRAGVKLFLKRVPSLAEAECLKSWGVKPLDLSAEPWWGQVDPERTARIRSTVNAYWPVLSAKRRGLKGAERPRPDVVVVDALRVTYLLGRNSIAEVSARSWKHEGTLLVVRDAEERGVAEELVPRGSRAEDASWYETVLREPDLDGALSRLDTLGLSLDELMTIERECRAVEVAPDEGAAGAVLEIPEIPPKNAEAVLAMLPEPPAGTNASDPGNRGSTVEVTPSPPLAPVVAPGPRQPGEQPPPDRPATPGPGRPTPGTPSPVRVPGFGPPRHGTPPVGTRGYAAERWMNERIEELRAEGWAFELAPDNMKRDEEFHAESDFIVRTDAREAHIELKSSGSVRDHFFWSARQMQKFATLAARGVKTWLVVVLEEQSAFGPIYWFAEPVDCLRGVSCVAQVQLMTKFLPYSMTDGWPPPDPTEKAVARAVEDVARWSSAATKIKMRIDDALQRPHESPPNADPMAPLRAWLQDVGE